MKRGLKHQFHTFPSGLRLVTVPMKNTRAATVFVLVGTGSKYETKDMNGISHFLEHMMFKGTDKRTNKMDIAVELDGIGASYNAFTHKEFTGYYASASSRKLDTIMDVVFDIFLNSKLDAQEIEREKGVIVEEINMYKDHPQRQVGELFEKLLYGDQPAGWEIAGEKDTVVKWNRDDFVKYFTSHYIAKNTVVAVTGRIDPEYVHGKVGEYFENIRKSEKPDKLAVVEEQSEPKTLVHFKETDQTHVVLGVRSYDMFDERRYALGILSNVLGSGMSSRLWEAVRENRGLAYYIGAGSSEYTDTGMFAVSAGINNEKVLEAISAIMEELSKAAKKGITAKELKRAKDNIEGHAVLGLESSMAVAEAYCAPILFHGKILTPEEELAKIRKVTLSQIKAVSRDIFDNKRLNLAVIGPFKDEAPFQNVLKFD